MCVCQLAVRKSEKLHSELMDVNSRKWALKLALKSKHFWQQWCTLQVKFSENNPKYFFKVFTDFGLAFSCFHCRRISSSPFFQIHYLHAVLWQAGNYVWFLSLHMFACLSLNYHTVPTVPVKVKQLKGCRALAAMLGGAPMGTTRFLWCASTADGGCLGFPVVDLYAEMNWHALLEQPSKEEREKERESTLGRANPDFRMFCSRLLSLTRGCNSHREECKTLIGPPTLVQCFGQSLRLTCIIVVAVHFFFFFTSGQSETTNRGLWPWDLPSA